jgi:hypothetical protein
LNLLFEWSSVEAGDDLNAINKSLKNKACTLFKNLPFGDPAKRTPLVKELTIQQSDNIWGSPPNSSEVTERNIDSEKPCIMIASKKPTKYKQNRIPDVKPLFNEMLNQLNAKDPKKENEWICGQFNHKSESQFVVLFCYHKN